MKKRTEINIERLKNQRRLNVQEQIYLVKDSILKVAKYWKDKGLPKPLKKLFEEKGIDVDNVIILDYQQDVIGGSTDEGLVLTFSGNFYEFDVDLNSDKTELIELYSLSNVSDKFEINEHKKGTGKTYGFLAMEVLKELNEGNN